LALALAEPLTEAPDDAARLGFATLDMLELKKATQSLCAALDNG
jgi:hypothetical protein